MDPLICHEPVDMDLRITEVRVLDNVDMTIYTTKRGSVYLISYQYVYHHLFMH